MTTTSRKKKSRPATPEERIAELTSALREVFLEYESDIQRVGPVWDAERWDLQRMSWILIDLVTRDSNTPETSYLRVNQAFFDLRWDGIDES